MARKVLISFLGTSNYMECKYSYKSNQSRVVKFVQSALIQLCCSEWTENDRIIVFTTEESLRNWESLRKECSVQVQFENRMIPAGKNEKEIWEIFQIMFDVLSERDEVHVDITNSFRSIPLIASSLLQYAKFLRNISVGAVYYGAFDALGSPRDVAEKLPDPEDRIAPVFDLTAFSKIQDWSIAANDFIGFGNTVRLNQLTDKDISPVVLRETKEQNKAASELKELNEYIEELSLNIRTNRGEKLIKGESSANIIKILGTLEQNLIKPLNLILTNLKHSVEKIHKKPNDKENMLLSVGWCIDKQLIQEGFTILQEGIISFLMEDYHDDEKRKFVSGFLNKYNPDNKYCSDNFDKGRFKLRDRDCEYLKKNLEERKNIEKWSKVFKELTRFRNDINHAGMRDNSMSAKEFADKLKELYDRTIKLMHSC